MPDSDELLQYQLQSGAVICDDAFASPPVAELGRPSVSHFGDAVAEYRAAQDCCAVFDLSDRVQIELRGEDARSFLQNFCTNDIERVAPGDGCEAFVTSVKGRILAHVFAFVERDAVWIDSPRTDEELLLAHFDRYLFNEKVQLHGHTAMRSDLYVSGAQCISRLAMLGLDIGPLAELQHTMRSVDGLSVVVRRVGFWDSPGYLISADRQQHVELWKRLVSEGIQPAGAQAFHTRRIEAGFPVCGIDLTDANLAQEAGRTGQAISFTKGCYLGQEPIARIDALGHINRQVSRLRIDTDAVLGPATPVVAPDETDVGVITSSMVVPGHSQTVALAMLRTSHSQAGTELGVRNDQELIAATVF